MPTMSANAYAKHRGVSGNAVKKAIQEGRITAQKNAKGQYDIDPEVADREWAENTMTPEKKAAQKAMEKFVEEQKLQDTERANEDWEEEQRGKLDPNAKLSYAEARRLKENYNAKKAKLKFEEESGLLIKVEQVKADAFNLARALRNQLLSLPDRISGELAAMDDSRKISSKLREEISSCLESLIQDE